MIPLAARSLVLAVGVCFMWAGAQAVNLPVGPALFGVVLMLAGAGMSIFALRRDDDGRPWDRAW